MKPMRRYELRFVTESGLVLRGPIFKRSSISEFKDTINHIDEMNRLTLTRGRRSFVVPKETLQRGYVEIRPVGLIYTLIRSWRNR